MPTDVIMPQMGESVFEGTITKWLKKPGDKVQRDEPLFEISTDKVDAEIPAPASGVLQDIKVTEGNTVQVNTIVGTIAGDGEASAVPAKPATQAAAPAAPKPEAPRPATQAAAPQPEAAQVGEEADEDHARSSPLVRKIAREHNVNLSQVQGTGLGGRITKQDIMAFVESGSGATGVSAQPQAQGAPSKLGLGGEVQTPTAPPSRPTPAEIPGDLVPMSRMRQIIAKHMIESRRTSAHVHAMFEVDLTRIVNIRNKQKAAFEQRNGARLTFMPFF